MESIGEKLKTKREELNLSIEQKTILERIDPERSNVVVEFGALVITNKQRIFVSIGLGKFVFEGQDYFVISPAVPFFKAMDGLKVGDSFEFRNQKFEIREVS